MIHPWITKLGGRRFILCFWCVNLCAALNILGTVSGAEFCLLIGGTAAAYITGNVRQKIEEAKHSE